MSNIYVISTAKHDNGPVKIGISDQPEKRLKQLQTAYPEPLEIKYLEKLDTKIKARTLEGKLHKDIKHKRSHGEWFNVSVKEAILFVQFTLIEHDDSTLGD